MKHAATLTTAAGTIAYLAVMGPPLPSQPAPHELPAVVLSEVHWDPIGSDAGSEWIELAVTGGLEEWDLSDHTIENGLGQVLYKFPPQKVRLGDTLLVSLGANRPTLAAKNLTHGHTHLLFSGQTKKDCLANAGDCLGLRSPDGTLVDFVVWGSAPPSGSALLAEAVDSGQWKAGDWVSTAYDADGPTHPGQTIGRDRRATDLDRAADWAGNGGPQAAGASPGAANAIDVENVGGLIELAQEAVNAAFLVYGSSTQELLRFAVHDSSFAAIDVKDHPGFHWEFDAQHSFTVEDTIAGGGPELWVGAFHHAFDETGPRAYRLAIQGQIQSPSGNRLSVDLTVDRGGYGGPQIEEVQAIDLSLTLNGVDLPFHSTNRTTSTLKGPGLVELHSVRAETSWGGQADSSELTLLTQDVGETSRTFTFDIASTPFGRYPTLGSPGTTSTDVVQVTGNGDATFTGMESSTVRIQSMTVRHNGQVRARIMPSDPASFAQKREAGTPGDATGTLRVTSHFPVYDATGSSVLLDFGHSEVVTVTQAMGKSVADSAVDLLVNGTTWRSGAFFVDPPQTYIPPPDDYQVAPPSYGKTGGNGGGVVRDIVRVGGSLAIAFYCVLGAASSAAGSAAAVPVTGGASLVGLVGTQKIALACAAGSILWAELW